MTAVFDRVVVADWSSAAAPSPPRESADAIWIGVSDAGGTTARYCRTRAEAETVLRELIANQPTGARLLIGFDFPMGYPAGFAARLTGSAQARAVWNWLARHIRDDGRNANNRFAVADAINWRLGGRGPFWGRPAGAGLAFLPARKEVDYAALGLNERRQVEQLVPGAQPVWKCYTTGSVGGQALVGLPLIDRLAALPGVAVWPFDPPGSPVVLAEVYPSLLRRPVRAAGDPIRDRAQVSLLSRALFRLSRDGGLQALLDAPRPPAAAEEGWILGAGHVAALEAALCA